MDRASAGSEAVPMATATQLPAADHRGWRAPSGEAARGWGTGRDWGDPAARLPGAGGL